MRRLAGTVEAEVGSSPCQLSALTPPPCEAPPSAPSGAMYAEFSAFPGRQPATKSKTKTKDAPVQECVFILTHNNDSTTAFSSYRPHIACDENSQVGVQSSPHPKARL